MNFIETIEYLKGNENNKVVEIGSECIYKMINHRLHLYYYDKDRWYEVDGYDIATEVVFCKFEVYKEKQIKVSKKTYTFSDCAKILLQHEDNDMLFFKFDDKEMYLSTMDTTSVGFGSIGSDGKFNLYYPGTKDDFTNNLFTEKKWRKVK